MFGAIVVSFNPGPQIARTVAALLDVGCRVAVVDNASSHGREHVDECATAGAQIVRLSSNMGVAEALNVGITACEDIEWVFTFDQDSEISRLDLKQMMATAAQVSARVSILAPSAVDRSTGRVLQGSLSAPAMVEVKRVITSGSLCRLAALQDVDGFWSGLFIDYVDFELCSRLRARGWSIQVMPDARIVHSIGEPRRRWGVNLSGHSAARLYYRFRNFILIIRSGSTIRQERVWLMRSLGSHVLTFVKVLLFENDRRSKLCAMLRGVFDGLSGVEGPMRECRS